MLSFSRKTDYALIALAHLAGRAGVASAREIGQTYRLPISLVMKILKRLQRHGIVKSVRGVNGGYQLGLDLHTVSLYDLIDAISHGTNSDDGVSAVSVMEPPLLAVHSKLMRFLKDVKLSDLVVPGRRIDVPIEMVGRKKNTETNPKCVVADLVATG
jgi:Rrf2 family protein